MSPYSAWHITGSHDDCGKRWYVNPRTNFVRLETGAADIKLGCSAQVIRVHVKNANGICKPGERCALRKFDLLGAEARTSARPDGWSYIGRSMMPNPGLTVL